MHGHVPSEPWPVLVLLTGIEGPAANSLDEMVLSPRHVRLHLPLESTLTVRYLMPQDVHVWQLEGLRLRYILQALPVACVHLPSIEYHLVCDGLIELLETIHDLEVHR